MLFASCGDRLQDVNPSSTQWRCHTASVLDNVLETTTLVPMAQHVCCSPMAAVRCSLRFALLLSPRARFNLNGPSSQVFDPFWFGYTRLGRFRKTGSVRGRASSCKTGFPFCAAPGCPLLQPRLLVGMRGRSPKLPRDTRRSGSTQLCFGTCVRLTHGP